MAGTQGRGFGERFQASAQVLVGGKIGFLVGDAGIRVVCRHDAPGAGGEELIQRIAALANQDIESSFRVFDPIHGLHKRHDLLHSRIGRR